MKFCVHKEHFDIMRSLCSKIALFIIAFNLADNKIVLTPDTALSTKSVSIPAWPQQVHAIKLQVGSGIELKKAEVSMIPDLGYSSIFIGEKSSAGFGIDCSPEVGCHIDDQANVQVYFQIFQFYAKKAFLPMTLLKDTKVPTEDYKKVRFDFKMPFIGNHWPYSDFSVLGLSPKSQFLTHLPQVYDYQTGLLLKTIDLEPERPSHVKNYQLQAVINPNITPETILAQLTLEKDSSHWLFPAKLTFLKVDNFLGSDVNVCVSLYEQSLISVSDPLALCDAVKVAACATKNPDECVKSKFSFERAQVLELSIAGKIFTFTAHDFVDFEGEKVVCNFGSIAQLKSIENCPFNANIALGKRFIQKYPIVLIPSAEGHASFQLLSGYSDPQPEPKKPAGWLLWALGLLIVAGIAAYAFLSNKNRSRSYTDDSMKYQSI